MMMLVRKPFVKIWSVSLLIVVLLVATIAADPHYHSHSHKSSSTYRHAKGQEHGQIPWDFLTRATSRDRFSRRSAPEEQRASFAQQTTVSYHHTAGKSADHHSRDSKGHDSKGRKKSDNHRKTDKFLDGLNTEMWSMVQTVQVRNLLQQRWNAVISTEISIDNSNISPLPLGQIAFLSTPQRLHTLQVLRL